jgi:lipid-A-disaccharide synthase
MIVAGEASGDKHGAALARALAGLNPGTKIELFGSGGEEMRAAGVETLVDAREVAIIGVPEIIGALGRLYGAYRRLIEAARARRPAAIVLIDWPDFNMRLARRLHREGFKIAYYISPQVWAWRRYRVKALRRDIDRMLVILPFEEDFYRESGVRVEYVGHPLVETVRATATRDEFSRMHGLDPARPLIALLPGSRKKEIHYHLPAMLDAALRLETDNCMAGPGATARRVEWLESVQATARAASTRSEMSYLRIEISNPRSEIHRPQFVVPLASTIERAQVEAIVAEADSERRLDVTIIERDMYNALAHAEAAAVSSGTATVETALVGTPMVIVYRASELNYRLIRPLIRLDTFGMVNLIAGRRVVPELMQRAVTGERIAREVTAILSDPDRIARMRRDLEEVRRKLLAGGGSGSERAARAVMGLIREDEAMARDSSARGQPRL